MIQQIIKRFKKAFATDEQISLETPQQTVARFVLVYQDLLIGTLELKNGCWIFQYSRQFCEQSPVHKVKPILNFPDASKVYESQELWPFFATRIPGLSQPQIKAIIQREKIDAKNPVSLLHRFGRETITNPFLLTPMAIA
jgi:HipA-like protein